MYHIVGIRIARTRYHVIYAHYYRFAHTWALQLLAPALSTSLATPNVVHLGHMCRFLMVNDFDKTNWICTIYSLLFDSCYQSRASRYDSRYSFLLHDKRSSKQYSVSYRWLQQHTGDRSVDPREARDHLHHHVVFPLSVTSRHCRLAIKSFFFFSISNIVNKASMTKTASYFTHNW